MCCFSLQEGSQPATIKKIYEKYYILVTCLLCFSCSYTNEERFLKNIPLTSVWLEIFIAQILPSIRKYTKYIRELGIHADDAIKVIKEPLMPLLLNQSVE